MLSNSSFNTTFTNATTGNKLRDLINNEQPIALRAVQAFILIAIMLVGFGGNSCLTIIITRSRKLRTRTNIFYISIAVANIGIAVLCIPFTLSSIFTGKWTLGDDLCYVNGILNPFYISACCYSVTTTTIHKFYSMTRPLTCAITRRRVYFLILAVWAASGLICIWPILQKEHIVYKPAAGHCGYRISEKRDEVYYLIFLACAVFLCPTLINTYCYVRIFRALRHHRARMKTSTVIDATGFRAQRRSIVTLYAVFVLFFLTWLPFNVYSILFVLNREDLVPNWMLAVAFICAYSTCAQIPVIVIYRSAQFRRDFCRVFCFAQWRNARRTNSQRKNANRISRQGASDLERKASAWYIGSERPVLELHDHEEREAEEKGKHFLNPYFEESRM